jgi:serine protease Do
MNQTGRKTQRWPKFFRRRFSLVATMLLVVLAAIISSVTVGSLISRKYGAPGNGREDVKRRITSPEGALKDSNLLKTNVNSAAGSVVAIARKTGPAVVGIRTTVQVPVEQFFGEIERSGSEGSGIIISKDGYILTNYHVVSDADPRRSRRRQVNLEVFLPDKRRTEAKFIGGDRINDLAVIKIGLKKLTVAELGDSSHLKVGALAVAIGNPLGLEFAGSVTTGVISALNRAVTMGDRTLKLIQTDAAINPGNSGGALVDAAGAVIGVNTVKIAVSGVEGLGFAIPINDVKPVVRQLIKYGYVKGRPLIGISGREITREIAEYYDLPLGIFIVGVDPEGGAAKAGIRKKDILTHLAGKRVMTMKELNLVKKGYHAGDTVKAVVRRGKKLIRVKLIFTEER